MKIRWKVAEKPTGRYKSFQDRGWPTCEDDKGNPIAMIRHINKASYTPHLAEHNDKPDLQLMIAYRADQETSFTWKGLTGRFRTVKQCKQALTEFIKKYPHYFINKKVD